MAATIHQRGAYDGVIPAKAGVQCLAATGRPTVHPLRSPSVLRLDDDQAV